MSFRIIASGILLASLAGCATSPPSLTPDALFQDGERLYAGKHYEEAINKWKKMKEITTAPDLIAQADLKIAEAQFANENYIEAAASYENFRKLHPGNEEVPFVVYRLGLCYYNQITGIDTDQTPVKNAATTFESFERQYPSSKYIAEVRKKLEDCRTKQLEYEIYVGRFYCRTGKYQASVKRLEEALVLYPKSKFHDEIFYYLGMSYLEIGERAKGKQFLTRLLDDFPTSKFAPDARKLLKKG